MATALTPTSQLALKAIISTVVAGRYDITLAEVRARLKRTPLLAACATRSDIALALRRAGFVRDRNAIETSYIWREPNSRLARAYAAWGTR